MNTGCRSSSSAAAVAVPCVPSVPVYDIKFLATAMAEGTKVWIETVSGEIESLVIMPDKRIRINFLTASSVTINAR